MIIEFINGRKEDILETIQINNGCYEDCKCIERFLRKFIDPNKYFIKTSVVNISLVQFGLVSRYLIKIRIIPKMISHTNSSSFENKIVFDALQGHYFGLRENKILTTFIKTESGKYYSTSYFSSNIKSINELQDGER